MPYVDVDVDLYDIYSSCSKSEKNELVNWLKNDGYLTKYENEYCTSNSPVQQSFEEDINKIKSSYLQISKEDSEVISTIAKKYS